MSYLVNLYTTTHYTTPDFSLIYLFGNSHTKGNLAILHSRRGVLDTQKLDSSPEGRALKGDPKRKQMASVVIVTLLLYIPAFFLLFACVNILRIYV